MRPGRSATVPLVGDQADEPGRAQPRHGGCAHGARHRPSRAAPRALPQGAATPSTPGEARQAGRGYRGRCGAGPGARPGDRQEGGGGRRRAERHPRRVAAGCAGGERVGGRGRAAHLPGRRGSGRPVPALRRPGRTGGAGGRDRGRRPVLTFRPGCLHPRGGPPGRGRRRRLAAALRPHPLGTRVGGRYVAAGGHRRRVRRRRHQDLEGAPRAGSGPDRAAQGDATGSPGPPGARTARPSGWQPSAARRDAQGRPGAQGPSVVRRA